VNGQIQVLVSSTGSSWDIVSNGVGSVVNNIWYHIAFTRSGNIWKLFLDGTEVYTTTIAIVPFSSSNLLRIGSDGNTDPNRTMNGYIDEVRITNGTARYITNFILPTAPFPNQ